MIIFNLLYIEIDTAMLTFPNEKTTYYIKLHITVSNFQIILVFLCG